jgi:hypothetical protein
MHLRVLARLAHTFTTCAPEAACIVKCLSLEAVPARHKATACVTAQYCACSAAGDSRSMYESF